MKISNREVSKIGNISDIGSAQLPKLETFPILEMTRTANGANQGKKLRVFYAIDKVFFNQDLSQVWD
jgi:hypothetical protein